MVRVLRFFEEEERASDERASERESLFFPNKGKGLFFLRFRLR